ncbi:MAG: DMT family transporter [Alphaproteobacteria bacterium]|nr:DMT family transporter [Alphaproteobacteria bacterium]
MTARAAGRIALLPYVLLSLTIAFWGLNGVVSKAAVAAIPPVMMTFLAWGVGALVLAPLALPRLWGHWGEVRRHWWKFAGLGALGFSLFYHSFFQALARTSAINLQLISTAIPAVIVIISVVLYRERVSLLAVLGMIIAFLGVAVVVAQGDPGLVARLGVNTGDLLAVAGVFVWSFYTLFLRYIPSTVPPIAQLWLFGVCGTVINAAVLLIEGVGVSSFVLDANAALMIGYVAVFPSFLAYLFYNEGVRMIGAAAAGQFLYLTPIVTAALAVLFLGETFALYHVVGLVTIFAGVFLASRRAAVAEGAAGQ